MLFLPPNAKSIWSLKVSLYTNHDYPPYLPPLQHSGSLSLSICGNTAVDQYKKKCNQADKCNFYESLIDKFTI